MFNDVSMQLQLDPPPNLGLVREMFDLLIEKFPNVSVKIGQDAAVVHSPVFETALIKSINGEILSEVEESQVNMFAIASTDDQPVNNMSISNQAAARHAKRLKKMQMYDLDAMKLIPPTSNLVERLFSKVGHIWTS